MVVPNHPSRDSATSSSSTSSSSNQRYRHPTSYTLYVEHLGTIIPVLEATKRNYKIRQAFGISLPSSSSSSPTTPQVPKTSGITESDSLLSASEGTVTTNSSQVRFLGHEAHLSLNTESGIQVACHDDDSESPRHPISNSSNSAPLVVDGAQKSSSSVCIDNSKFLAEVTSNIMTSKFKIVGLSEKVPADMGSVMIKTSFLHIQPRKVIAYLPHPELTADSGIDTDTSSDESVTEEGISSVIDTPCSADIFMEPESHSIESLLSMEELLLPKSVEVETQNVRPADTSAESSNNANKATHSSSTADSGNGSGGTYSCTSTSVRGQRVSVSESHIQIHSKTPTWNEQHMIYQLDFGGRVTTKSAKNFQLEMDNEQVCMNGHCVVREAITRGKIFWAVNIRLSFSRLIYCIWLSRCWFGLEECVPHACCHCVPCVFACCMHAVFYHLCFFSIGFAIWSN